jgi:hypothetical protein
LGDFLQGCSGGARNWFGQLKPLVFFGLAGVLGIEDFLQADDLRSGHGGIPDSVDGTLQIDVRLGHTGHLAEGSSNLRLAGHGITSRKIAAGKMRKVFSL